VLEFRSVGKSFPGVRALHEFSLTIEAGTVRGLVGENGAGKSTLGKILGGVYADYEGEMLFDDELLKFHSPRDAQRAGIALIHQELQLIPELSIAENIFLGRERHGKLFQLDRATMARESESYLERLHLDISPRRAIKNLRVGEQQLVEIAKALSLDAKLLIFDEPTAALNETEVTHLFEVIRRLRAAGHTIIYISHKLGEIFEITDEVTVLRDGELVESRPTSDWNERELIDKMVGRSLTDLYPKTEITLGATVVDADHLCLSSPGIGRRELKDVSFKARSGEIVGVAGLLGAGRTELLETLYGVYPSNRVSGRITIDDESGSYGAPANAIAAGLALVPEDRKNLSLVMTSSVAHNITLAALGDFMTAGVIHGKREREAVQTSIKDLRIKTPSSESNVSTLSGGNQQKVVLAKCLLTKPRVLLLDEPTRGIDVGAKAEIYTLIGKIAEGGAAVLMASSELLEMLAICDRILVLSDGELVVALTQAEATEENIMEAATRAHRSRPAAAVQ
jgi:ribose transport system ATP-binding protein